MANDRREQSEVGVGPPGMRESLESESSIGQRQMAMEHGAGLEVVEVVLVERGAKRVEWNPKCTENPAERHRGDCRFDRITRTALMMRSNPKRAASSFPHGEGVWPTRVNPNDRTGGFA